MMMDKMNAEIAAGAEHERQMQQTMEESRKQVLECAPVPLSDILHHYRRKKTSSPLWCRIDRSEVLLCLRSPHRATSLALKCR